MKRKNIIITVIIILLVAVSGVGIKKYMNYKTEKERLAKKPYFTQYSLTTDEMDNMITCFYVNTNPKLNSDWYLELNKSKWPDYSDFTMKPTKNTEKVVAVLNYDLFVRKSESDKSGLQKATQLGFSDNKKLTVDWVIKHPKEAVSIMMNMSNKGYIYRQKLSYINDMYDEITNGKKK